MSLLALTTGMRSSEICGILWEDTRLANHPPLITTKVKGGKWTEFELTATVVQAIEEYLAQAGRKPKKGEGLFCSVLQVKDPKRQWRPLNPFNFYDQVRRTGEKAGLGRISPHTFRHSHAQLLNGHGWSVPEIQGSLGHKSSQTTRIYLDKLAPRSCRSGQVIEAMLNGEDEE